MIVIRVCAECGFEEEVEEHDCTAVLAEQAEAEAVERHREAPPEEEWNENDREALRVAQAIADDERWGE